MLGTADEAWTNSQATFSYGLLYMGIPVLADQQKRYQLFVNLPEEMTNRDVWRE